MCRAGPPGRATIASRSMSPATDTLELFFSADAAEVQRALVALAADEQTLARAVCQPSLPATVDGRDSACGPFSSELFGRPGSPERAQRWGVVPLPAPLVHPGARTLRHARGRRRGAGRRDRGAGDRQLPRWRPGDDRSEARRAPRGHGTSWRPQEVSARFRVSSIEHRVAHASAPRMLSSTGEYAPSSRSRRSGSVGNSGGCARKRGIFPRCGCAA